MKCIRGRNIRKFHRGCALTIGNFDDIHRGHKYLFHNLRNKIAYNYKIPVIVMLLFETHQRELILGSRVPVRLTCLRHKINIIEKYEVYGLLCVKFNHIFQNYLQMILSTIFYFPNSE